MLLHYYEIWICDHLSICPLANLKLGVSRQWVPAYSSSRNISQQFNQIFYPYMDAPQWDPETSPVENNAFLCVLSIKQFSVNRRQQQYFEFTKSL